MQPTDDPEVTQLDEHPQGDDEWFAGRTAEPEAAVDKLPHCKDPTHCHPVVVGPHLTTHVTATRVAHLACHNTEYTGPGIVLSRKHGAPLDGLHMLPALIGVMPGELRQCAAQAPSGHEVSIVHTDNKAWVEFATVTPADAIALADAIEKAWAA